MVLLSKDQCTNHPEHSVLLTHRGLAAILFLSAAMLAATGDCLIQIIQERHKNHNFSFIILNLEFEKKKTCNSANY